MAEHGIDGAFLMTIAQRGMGRARGIREDVRSHVRQVAGETGRVYAIMSVYLSIFPSPSLRPTPL